MNDSTAYDYLNITYTFKENSVQEWFDNMRYGKTIQYDEHKIRLGVIDLTGVL